MKHIAYIIFLSTAHFVMAESIEIMNVIEISPTNAIDYQVEMEVPHYEFWYASFSVSAPTRINGGALSSINLTLINNGEAFADVPAQYSVTNEVATAAFTLSRSAASNAAVRVNYGPGNDFPTIMNIDIPSFISTNEK